MIAVEICKDLNRIKKKYCCGCRDEYYCEDCIMLTEEEKIELQRNVDEIKTIERFLRTVSPRPFDKDPKAVLMKWLKTANAAETRQAIKDMVKIRL